MTKRLLAILLGLTVIVFAIETFAQGTWTTKAPMPTARGNFDVGVVGTTLYAVGGFNNASQALKTVEAYDSVTDMWSTKAPMSTPRNGIAVGVVNGLVYAVGGDTDAGNAGFLASVEAYNPGTNMWLARAPMSTTRSGLGVGVVNDILYALGGYNGVYHSTVEAYNPVTNTWSPRAPMPTARAEFAVGVVDDVLYAVGGSAGSVVFSTVEAYDPVTDTWSTKAPMPTARTALATAVVNGILYAIGGINGGCSTPCSVVEAYDPATNTWTTVSPPMPTGRYHLAADAIGSSFYAVGGTSAQGYTGVLEVFTPEPTAPSVPATLTLDPLADTNPVDSEHCVTATVKDAAGSRVPGVTVRFTVTGAMNTSGSATTDENGEARFCYQGPPLPGEDAITAYADTDGDNVQDLGEPSGAATKTWTPPVTTPLCDITITNGGRITAANGDPATFGGNAQSDIESNVQGQEQYQDHGPAQPLNVHSINVLAIVCEGTTRASIYGEATIDGAGSFSYRISVNDLGEPGVGHDTYGILLGNGYASGEQTLEGGNVQIRRD